MLPVQLASTIRETLLQPRIVDANQPVGAAPGDNVFSGMLRAAQQSLHAVDTSAQTAVTGLLSGQGVDVHDAMIATQRADLSFELALQVRNKAVAAYQQMLGMQF